MESKTAMLLMGVSSLLSMTGESQAPISLGTDAPPSSIGGYELLPFADARPLFDEVLSVPTPLAQEITFSAALLHVAIGNGWATWSHGYSGDVYYYPAENALQVSLPAQTCAFVLYLEPNAFSTFVMRVRYDSDANEYAEEPIQGNAGAKGFAVVKSGDQLPISVTIEPVTPGTAGFSVGEFSIASCPCEDSDNSKESFGHHLVGAVCLADLPDLSGPKKGWTNEIAGGLADGASLTLAMYAGAEDCDIAQARLDGTVVLTRVGELVHVEAFPLALNHVRFQSMQVYLGPTEAPPIGKQGKMSSAPGLFSCSDNLVNNDALAFDCELADASILDSDLFVIVRAVTHGCKV